MDAPHESLDLVDRLVAEYADRLARDEDPRREELLAEAPHLRAELERCFRMLDGRLEGPGEERPHALAAGLELGDYRLGPVLGRGGMAVVYEAEQKSLRRAVALKVLRQHLTLDARNLERFQREAHAAAKLSHPNVVPIHAVGAADGHAFIAFELVRGPTLAQVVDALARLGRRPTAADLARATGNHALAGARGYPEACVRLLGGVLAAVEHAHAQGVIHRDLKPSNILLTAAGEPRVADFGLAKDLGEASLSLTGETLGTPHYMAPEQAGALARRVDARTDVYALGVVLFELLTLRRPFEGRTFAELVQRIVTAAPRSPCELAPDVPAGLGDVVRRAMAKEPERRYASVAELAADLERALAGAEVRAEPSRGMAALFGGWFESRLAGRPFEYRTRATLLGLPWIHVVEDVRDPATGHPKWAKGVVAVGNQAVGLYAAGRFAVGLVSLGFIAVGPVALGALALGHVALGGLAAGWQVLGGMVVGNSGRGLLSAWLRHPETPATVEVLSGAATRGGPPPALFPSLLGILLSFTLVHGIWTRLWPGEAQRALVGRVTRRWMPLAYLLPLALRGAGLELPLLADLAILVFLTVLGGLLVRQRLGAPIRPA